MFEKHRTLNIALRCLTFKLIIPSNHFIAFFKSLACENYKITVVVWSLFVVDVIECKLGSYTDIITIYTVKCGEAIEIQRETFVFNTCRIHFARNSFQDLKDLFHIGHCLPKNVTKIRKWRGKCWCLSWEFRTIEYLSVQMSMNYDMKSFEFSITLLE